MKSGRVLALGIVKYVSLRASISVFVLELLILHPFSLPLDNRRLATIINQNQVKMRFQNLGIFFQSSSDAGCNFAEILAKPVRSTANAKALAIQDQKSDASSCGRTSSSNLPSPSLPLPSTATSEYIARYVMELQSRSLKLSPQCRITDNAWTDANCVGRRYRLIDSYAWRIPNPWRSCGRGWRIENMQDEEGLRTKASELSGDKCPMPPDDKRRAAMEGFILEDLLERNSKDSKVFVICVWWQKRQHGKCRSTSNECSTGVCTLQLKCQRGAYLAGVYGQGSSHPGKRQGRWQRQGQVRQDRRALCAQVEMKVGHSGEATSVAGFFFFNSSQKGSSLENYSRSISDPALARPKTPEGSPFHKGPLVGNKFVLEISRSTQPPSLCRCRKYSTK